MVPGSALRAFVAALALAGAVAAPALAAEDASIAHVESGKSGLQLLVNVPPDAEVDLEGVTLTVNGLDTEATASSANSTTSVERTAVLAIDTSNSMRGARFAAAQDAARTFLDALPPDVVVGIVSFAGDVEEVLPPTDDRELARSVVDGLTLGPQTRLYDGVLAAVRLAGSDGQRTLLVLSDGADTGGTELDAVTKAVRDSEVIVDVVSLEQSGRARAALRELADAGSGRVIDADPKALAQAFADEADVLARQVVVDAELPATFTGRDATLVVTLPTSAGVLTAEAFAPVSKSAVEHSGGIAPPALTTDRGLVLDSTWLYAGIGSLALGLLLVLLLLVPRRTRELGPAERAMMYTDRIDGRSGIAASSRTEPEQALTQAKDAAAKVLARNKGLAARIAARLEGAGNPLKPAEWLLLHVAIFGGAGLVGLLLGRGNLFVGLLFLAVGLFGPWMWLGFRRSRRRKAFDSSLPDTLQLMSGSLAAGLSLAQSVDTIVREGVEPVASEFKRVLVETRLGVSLEDALDGVAERFESKDFAWVVMAIKIQRQVGGNLAELLDTVAATMREREYMRRQVAALAAEGKLSAWVLGGLPPAFMLYLLMTNRDYVMVMFTDPIGWAMLAGAGMLLSLGIFWMSRLAKVEV